MDQQEINRREWENPLNWSGPRWLGVYASERDTRTWVPKRMPTMGWTLNFGRPAARWWLVGLLVGIPLVFIVVTSLVGPR